ncbi:BZ3500_MvSof-1268-A1-R1_Chr11-1g03180 [Microbotryum saponariae]|uniref:BZ3500_MvSof-1268-A1-R1_Chr11-1g03180 protein n=1 Tax=Microbotryum saponariae TaxID=289078 RepID=A0A2X0NC73_9BASI|nr:BZ3501_MvSof-1269-A2-R1_Chr11g02755 [Microbotryum saponariae]SDA03740.1 BZ3500_MvSof-1268-A1-R1_Chr11-1g03180 [Microbotryum saponariae]
MLRDFNGGKSPRSAPVSDALILPPNGRSSGTSWGSCNGSWEVVRVHIRGWD